MGLDPGAGLRGIKVAGDDQGGICWRIEVIEELPGVLQRGRFDVRACPDHAVALGVTFGKEGLEDGGVGRAIGGVF